MKIVYLLLLFLLIFGCTNSNNKKDVYSEQDSYEIYNIILKKYITTYSVFPKNTPERFRINSETFDSYLKKYRDSIVKSGSLNFSLNNKLTVLDTLDAHDENLDEKNSLLLNLKPQISKKKINFKKIDTFKIAKKLESEPRFNNFENYPQDFLGFYNLSLPIFNENLMKAVIRLDVNCGTKCGYGKLIYLRKINDKWKIFKEKQIWTS